MPNDGLRHGFKTEAETIAEEVRRDLGREPSDPLCMWTLAAHLDVPVMALSKLHEAASSVAVLTGPERGAFSALTVFRGSERIVLNNDGHSVARQSSNLAHELAHALLMHEPRPPLDERGCRDWDDTSEKEADWVGGCLLIPKAAAFRIASQEQTQELDIEALARNYVASSAMLNYRLNVTAARKVMKRRSLRA